MKESGENITSLLIKDVINPEFINHFSPIKDIVFEQGQIIVNPAHYEKDE